MKRLLGITLLLALLFPGTALAQDTTTPTQLQAEAQQAANQAGSLQGQAAGLRAQASGLDQQAAQSQQRAQQLLAQAAQLAANQAAIGVAQQAQQAAGEAKALYDQAARLESQAKTLDAQAEQQWRLASFKMTQALALAAHLTQAALVNTTQQSLNAARLSGQVYEQGHTIVMLNNQRDQASRLLLAEGLLSLVVIVVLAWLLVRRHQEQINHLTAVFAKTTPAKDTTAVVKDSNVSTYLILKEVADGTR
jgi:hypothetical protein